MNKHTTHIRFFPVLIFLIVGSFIAWLIFRKRTLKEECTHYEYNYRFWRNVIIGGIVVIGIIYCLDMYLDAVQDAEYDEWKKLLMN